MRYQELRNWTVNDQTIGLVYFAQKLDELLFDYSLDSYKPYALNSVWLVREALSIISQIENRHIDFRNLAFILDELAQAIKNDKVAKQLLDLDAKYYLYSKGEGSLEKTKLRLKVLARTLEPNRYIMLLSEKLATAITLKQKSDIDEYASHLLTTLINFGVSKGHLYSRTQEYFFRGRNEINSIEHFLEFFKTITPISHNYDLYFIASKLILEVRNTISAFNIEILEALPDDLKNFADANEFTPNDSEVYVHVSEVSAFDRQTARHLADQVLDSVGDLFTLYHHRERLIWSEQSIVVQCCEDDILLMRSPKSAMLKARDIRPRKASKQLENIVVNLGLIGGPSFSKFTRAVDLHGIAVTNDVPENQLLNVWTAIETVVPPNVSTSKIRNIVSRARPFIALSYLKRIIDQLLIDLLAWNRDFTKSLFAKVPNSRGLKFQIRLLRLLAYESNSDLRSELYAELGDFELLKYRVFRLSEVMRSPRRIEEFIEKHTTNVEWQMRRIYRTRNLIIHTGESPSFLNTVIENGHDYLDTMLFEIVQLSCSAYNVTSFEEAFELADIQCAAYFNRLAQYDSFNGVEVDFLYRFHEWPKSTLRKSFFNMQN